MKDEELNNKNRSTDSEWNWINQHSGHYDRNTVRNFFGNERIRVTFSDKLDDNTENFTNQNITQNNYIELINNQVENKNEPDEEKPVNKNPGKEIENPEPSQKPEVGDGGDVRKEKPEIRYDIE